MEKTVGKQPNRSAFLRQPGKEETRLKLKLFRRVIYLSLEKYKLNASVNSSSAHVPPPRG